MSLSETASFICTIEFTYSQPSYNQLECNDETKHRISSWICQSQVIITQSIQSDYVSASHSSANSHQIFMAQMPVTPTYL